MPAMIDPEPITSTSARTNIHTGVCPLCGATLHNPEACDRCDWVKGYGELPPELQHNPRDVFAFVLSLFWPGLGHFYKGQKGWAMAAAGLGMLCFLWAITFFMFFGFLVFPACWLFFAIDAYFRKDVRHTPWPATPRTA